MDFDISLQKWKLLIGNTIETNNLDVDYDPLKVYLTDWELLLDIT